MIPSVHEKTRDMIPFPSAVYGGVHDAVHGGDWIACDVVSPGMGGRCFSFNNSSMLPYVPV